MSWAVLVSALLAAQLVPLPEPIGYFDPVPPGQYAICQAWQLGPDGGYYHLRSCMVSQDGRVYIPGWQGIIGWSVAACRPATKVAKSQCSAWVGPD